MTQSDNSLPIEHPTVTMSDPARTITVSSNNGVSTHVQLTAAALTGSEDDVARKVLAVAKFGRDRGRAILADALVERSVASGDNEAQCRRYLSKEKNLPTQDEVDAAYAAHYQQPHDS
ncbi:hypothetical protein [Mycobacteroides abscessus]|uniref:hypothetical protein n=1 Tax=Mycobacteroides abscessus TaxID=36809 RepID=UPI0021076408|nr:hypothetical protein [Mycobacteroides abscessus]